MATAEDGRDQTAVLKQMEVCLHPEYSHGSSHGEWVAKDSSSRTFLKRTVLASRRAAVPIAYALFDTKSAEPRSPSLA